MAARPGLRVPGAWDGFELAVRAILGQQITVAAATALAARLKTSQSRVAKMEAADATVSIDLLLQTLFRLGMKRRQLAKAI